MLFSEPQGRLNHGAVRASGFCAGFCYSQLGFGGERAVSFVVVRTALAPPANAAGGPGHPLNPDGPAPRRVLQQEQA